MGYKAIPAVSAVTTPASTTDNAIVRWDGVGGGSIKNSLMTVDDNGSPNIPTGQHYKKNGANLAAVDVGAQPTIANATPASAGATGVKGTICWDTSYIYVCVDTNTWLRAAIATWP